MAWARWKPRSRRSRLEVATMRNPPQTRFHNYFGLKKIARCGFSWEKTTKAFSASVYTYCETALMVAAIATLLTFAAGASAQTPAPAQSDNGQSVPDAPAPQPQKKPAPKPQPPSDSTDSSSHSTPPADAPAPKQPAAKDDNAFPEAVSRDAAKAASDAAGSTKPSTAADNPFPEAVSRDAAKSASPDADSPKKSPADDNPFPEAVSHDAAKAAGNDQNPAPKSDLPPGVSSSQSSSSLDDADNPAEGRRLLPNPGRAKKDAEVGGFYLKNGDYQGALLRYQDAMAVDPTNVDAIFGLAETQQMLKKNADAARNYQLYLDIVPNGPKAKQAMKALKTLQAAK
jgi:tetratricopeptide repeat protein